MGAVNGRLSASTLAETLVMMLVAGIVFLTVMEGVTLFSRLVGSRAQALLENGRQTDGYFRIAGLIARSDSILAPETGGLEMYQAGRQSQLVLRDSVVVYRRGEFCDTLLRGVGSLRLTERERGTDSVEISFSTGFKARFAVVEPRLGYRMSIEETEEGYGYEE